MKRMLSALCALAILSVAAAAAKDSRKAYMKPFDKDGNGTVTAAERKAGRQKRFKAHDRDQDGKLTESEFVEGHMQWFNEHDSGKDGAVAPVERLDYMCGQPKSDGKADKAGKKPDLALKANEDCIIVHTAIFNAADANGDGKLTKDENTEYLRKLFTKMDKNQDGFLVVQEFYAGNVVAELPTAKKQ